MSLVTVLVEVAAGGSRALGVGAQLEKTDTSTWYTIRVPVAGRRSRVSGTHWSLYRNQWATFFPIAFL